MKFCPHEADGTPRVLDLDSTLPYCFFQVLHLKEYQGILYLDIRKDVFDHQ